MANESKTATRSTDPLHDTLASALTELLREVARRDGEGNLLPTHLPAMRGATQALREYGAARMEA